MSPLVQLFGILCSISFVLSAEEDDDLSWLSQSVLQEEEIDFDMNMNSDCVDDTSEIKTCQDLKGPSQWKSFNQVTYDGVTYTKDTSGSYQPFWQSTDPNSEGILQFGCVNALPGLESDNQIWISFQKKKITINAYWAYLHSPNNWYPFSFTTFMKEYGVIEGRDTDSVGGFSIDGQVEWKKNLISWHKAYDGGWGWDYEGTVDINTRMLSGTYRHPGSSSASGYFKMKFPSDYTNDNAELWDYLIQSRDKKERALTKTIKGLVPDQTNRLFFYANYFQFATSTYSNGASLLVDCPGEQREFVTPHQIPDGVTVNLQGNSKLRRFNGVSRWLIKGENIGGWPFNMAMAGSEYGFESGESKVSISMRANCKLNECDGFYALGFGDNQYIVFGTDFDANGLRADKDVGLQIYPACGGSVASGNAADLLSNLGSNADFRDFRDALGGGDRSNFELLSVKDKTNGEAFPVTIELINDDNAGTITFRFASPSFRKGLECTYNSAINTGQDLNMYFTSDWWTDKGDNTEMIAIRSFVLYGKRFRSIYHDDGDGDDEEMMMFNGEGLFEDERVKGMSYPMVMAVVVLMAMVFGVWKYCGSVNKKDSVSMSSEIDPLLNV